MANKQIKDLTTGTAAGTDQVAIDTAAGLTRKLTLTAVLDWIRAQIVTVSGAWTFTTPPTFGSPLPMASGGLGATSLDAAGALDKTSAQTKAGALTLSDTLTINKTAEAGVAEVIANFKTSDDAVGSFKIMNSNAGDLVFLPLIDGTGPGSNAALAIRATATSDAGTQAVGQFVTRTAAGAVITTRPYWEWRNNTTVLMQMLPLAAGAAACLSWGTTTAAAPTFTNRSGGNKLVLYNSLSATVVDSAVGMGGTGPWISTGQATSSWDVSIYGGTTKQHTFRGDGFADHTGTIRATGATVPTTGKGIEFSASAGTGNGTILNYDRDTSAYKALSINALSIDLMHSGTSGVNIAAATGVVCNLPVVFKSYTIATLPTAASFTRGQAWASDHTGGARFVYSDGTNWRDVRTGSVAA